MSSRDVIVTGATGLLGLWLVPLLLDRGHTVFALVRGAEGRRAAVEAQMQRRCVSTARLHLVSADLDRDDLGLTPADRARFARVSRIFHLGASFAWGLTEAEALRTNVEGTRRVVSLAASLPEVPRAIFIGGYRLGPRRDPKGRLYTPGHASMGKGAYEASKHLAHAASIEACVAASVPYTVVHPCSVIGDSRTGETTQVTGLGESIVALAQGALPARAFGKDTFVPLVTVDFVADFLVAIAERDDAVGKQYPLLDPRTPVLDALIDRAARDLGVAAPRLRVPTWLVRALPERITRTSREALAFLDDARYPAEETEAMIASLGLTMPDIELAFDRWARFVVARSQETSVSFAGALPAGGLR